ncbi:MAG: hypothetical protein EHM87_03845 [Burkholderiales bacterium]|nr:MAG: hypothetical protein EHM87_03845 [Burkholderiales bacterium]
MTPAPVLTTHALLAIGFAIPMLFAPDDFLWLYGASPDADGIYLARLFGAALVAISIVTWLAREAPEGLALDALCVGLSIGCAIGFVVSVHHQLTHPAAGPLGWTTVGVFAGLAAVYGALWLGREARRGAASLQAG